MKGKKNGSKSLSEKILAELSKESKTLDQLLEIFPDSKRSTIRGRLSSLRANGSIKKRNNTYSLSLQTTTVTTSTGTSNDTERFQDEIISSITGEPNGGF